MKKIYVFISFFLIPFIIFIFILFSPRDYETIYNINSYKIKESYSLKNKMYKIVVTYNNLDYPLTFTNKYTKNRKIVENITSLTNDEENCLSIIINKETHPVCYSDGKLADYRMMSNLITDNYKLLIKGFSNNVIKKYNNINVYNYYNKKFFIWNYKGYDYISQNQTKTLNLLSEDDYNNQLVYKNDKYILTPNYDEKYYFTKFLVIDSKKLELFDFELDNEISYSTYYLGEIKNNIYLVDKKNKKQYKININKNTIKTIGTENKKGTIYINKKWEEISLNKLVNEEYKFPVIIKYDYQLINNKLYLIIDDYRILLSKNNVKDIIYINYDEVYYIVEDTLYVYTPKDGEVKLIENNEWNFNYDNKIMIFD